MGMRMGAVILAGWSILSIRAIWAGDDIPVGIAVDQYGNVFVTGASYDSIFGFDIFTIKYDKFGDTVWTRRYNGPGDWDDVPVKMQLDNAGWLYITGTTYGGYSKDVITLKYNASDNLQQWSDQFGGASNDVPKDLLLDSNGDIYVVGTVAQSTNDIFALKYDADGNRLWAQTYDGPKHYSDGASAAILDANENLCVTGATFQYWMWIDNPWGPGYLAPFYDYITIKYSPTGETVWTRQRNIYESDWAEDIATDLTGNVYVTGNTGTVKYDSSGQLIWSRSSPKGSTIVANLQNDFYLVDKYTTTKCSPAGNAVWSRSYGGVELMVDGFGHSHVVGGTIDIHTIKYDSLGNIIWLKTYNGPANGPDFGSALDVDDSGSVYITGKSQGFGTGYDYVTLKYSSQGEVIWVKRYNHQVCSVVSGDVNSSGWITIGDIVELVNYLFDKDKPPCKGIDPGNCWTPNPLCRADVNALGTITLGDVVHLLNYMFDRDRLPCLGTDAGNCWTPEPSQNCCSPTP